MSVSRDDAEKALELSITLWEQRETLTLDEVDGAFYWYVCRDEEIEAINDLWLEGKDDESIAPLYALEAQFPNAESYLRGGYWPPMRGTLVSWEQNELSPIRAPSFSDERVIAMGFWLCLGITNSRMSGEDVEEIARQHRDHARASAPQTFQVLESRSSQFVGMHFQLYPADSFRLAPEHRVPEAVGDRDWRLKSPVVFCRLHYPFPPDGMIASAYEGIVRTQHRWHTELYGYGEGVRQEIEVAIRTWAIGLQVASGVRFNDALRTVETYLQTSISNPGFTEDRKRLVRRVPEAREFLYAKPPRQT